MGRVGEASVTALTVTALTAAALISGGTKILGRQTGLTNIFKASSAAARENIFAGGAVGLTAGGGSGLTDR
jgi:hypothetical protein